MLKLQKSTSIFRIAMLFLMAFIFNINGVNAQSGLIPMDQGLPGPVLEAVADGNDIYAIVSGSQNTVVTWSTPVYLYRWTGGNWAKLKQFTLNGWYKSTYEPTRHLIVYKSKLYLINTGIPINSVNEQIAFWDGENWASTGFGDGYIAEAAVFKGKLYVAGDFFKAGTVSCHYLASFDGNNWNYVGPSSSDEGLEGGFSCMMADKDRLYFGGFSVTAPNVSKKATGRIISWDGTKWAVVANNSEPDPIAMFKFENELYSFNLDACRRWDGSRWNDASAGLQSIIQSTGKDLYISMTEEYNGKFWTNLHSLKMGEKSRLIYWTGNSWVDSKITPETAKDTITSIVKTNNGLYVLGLLSDYKNSNLSNAAKLWDRTGKFSGVIFEDQNENCIQDAGEKGTPNSFLEITPGPYIVSTDNKGKYTIYLDSGTYNIHFSGKKYWNQVCPSGNKDRTIQMKEGNEISQVNFGIKEKEKVNDLQVSVYSYLGFRARAGFYEEYVLHYKNVGTKTLSGKIILKYGSQASNLKSDVTPDESGKGRVAWNFSNLAPEISSTIYFAVRIDSAAKIGDTIAFVVQSDSNLLGADIYTPDNSDTLKQRIVASLDPNDKQSWPSGKIAPDTREVKYMIRFQNEGTDTAYRVVVIDTLDMRLPITKVKLNGTSHPYKIEIRHNVIKWTFDNILLTTKEQDAIKSQGFLTFVTQLKPGMAIGTQINNRAHIFFDYQKPVITKYAQFRLGLDVDPNNTSSTPELEIKTKSLLLYPNPAANEVNISNTSGLSQTVFLFDATGRLMNTIQLQAGEVQFFNTSTWTNGLYLIRTSGGESGKLVIQH